MLYPLVVAVEVELAFAHGSEAGELAESASDRGVTLGHHPDAAVFLGLLPEGLKGVGAASLRVLQAGGRVFVPDAVPGGRVGGHVGAGGGAGHQNDAQAHDDHDLVPHD